jgi:hydrogenase maturation protein HypF
VDDVIAALLGSPRAPIVLRPRRLGAEVADGVAPGDPRLGVMLAATPLHHLLLREVGRALVATSGNRSDEPICTDDDEAVERLAGIADPSSGTIGRSRACSTTASSRSCPRGVPDPTRARLRPASVATRRPGPVVLAVGGT